MFGYYRLSVVKYYNKWIGIKDLMDYIIKIIVKLTKEKTNENG